MWLWRLKRRVAFGHVGFVAEFLIGHFIHADLRLCGILLVFLAALRRGVRILFLNVVLTCAVRIFFVLALFVTVVVLIVQLIGVVAKLIAIPQIGDHLAGKFGKFGLIR